MLDCAGAAADATGGAAVCGAVEELATAVDVAVAAAGVAVVDALDATAAADCEATAPVRSIFCTVLFFSVTVTGGLIAAEYSPTTAGTAAGTAAVAAVLAPAPFALSDDAADVATAGAAAGSDGASHPDISARSMYTAAATAPLFVSPSHQRRTAPTPGLPAKDKIFGLLSSSDSSDSSSSSLPYTMRE